MERRMKTKVQISSNKKVVSPGASALGETSFLRIGERPLAHSLERGIKMGEPYECMDGMCRDVVSWTPMGVLSAVAITAIAVVVFVRIIEQVRRK